MREIKTLRPTFIQRAIKNMEESPDLKSAINDKDYEKVVDILNPLNGGWGWAILGIILSSLYQADPYMLNDLGCVPSGCFSYTDITDFTCGSNIKSIESHAFYLSKLGDIHISKSVESIGDFALISIPTSKQLDIYYEGTYNEWRQIKKGSSWASNRYQDTGVEIILHCSDQTKVIKGA